MWAGRRYPNGTFITTERYFPLIEPEDPRKSYRDEKYLTISEVKSLLGLDTGFGNKIETISGSDVSVEFTGFYDKEITISVSNFKTSLQWNFSTLRCYKNLDETENPYEENVMYHRIKRYANKFIIVVPTPCSVYYNVQSLNV